MAEKQVWSVCFRGLKKNFIAGILLILPLVATVFFLWWVFDRIINPLVDGLVRPFLLLVVPKSLHELMGLRTLFVWDLIAVIFLFLLVVAIGILARTILVRKLISLYEKIFSKIPIVNKIYGTIHQISKAFFGVERTGFKRVVLFEYPRKECWTFGFVSGLVRGELPGRGGEKVLNLFVPTTPNPTSGYLVQVPEKDTLSLDITVSEAFELIISAGAISPDLDKIKKEGAAGSREHNGFTDKP